MTDPVMTWQISVDIKASIEVNGQTFENVIETVHWRVTATDEETGESAAVYGSKSLPPPSSADDLIDLQALQELEPEPRRLRIMELAESIDEGYLYAQDAKAREVLASKLAAPAVINIPILGQVEA